MAHNLDITDGVASFVSAREDAWHRLGTTLEDAFTAEEAMDQGHLGGWNVRKSPIFAAEGSLEIPGQYAVLRNNPVDGRVNSLGVVGPDYTIVQNEAHAELLNTIVDESGAHFETAGALNGGRQVFLTMKLPGHLSVGGVDQVDNYLAAVNSHDGSSSFRLFVTPVRIVCQNTLNVALGKNKKAAISVRHTRHVQRQVIQQARSALGLAFDYLDDFQVAAERMIQTTLTQNRFEEIIEAEFGAKTDTLTAATRATNRLDRMAELFSDAATQDGVRHTAWAGFNALTEYWDHFSPVNAEDKDLGRAMNAAFAPERLKDRAYSLMMAEVVR